MFKKDNDVRVNIAVFCVCGCDHMTKFRLANGFGSAQRGVVVVPRDNSDEILLEKPNFLKYVADPIPGEECAISSTKLRQSIIDGDKEYIKKALVSERSNEAARCILQPTLRE